MIYIRNCTMRSSALQGTALAMLTSLALLYAPVGAGFWSGAGWAQDVPQAQRAVKPLGASQPTTPVPVATTLPVREPTAGMLGTDVAACDKDTQNPETLILPGAKGDFKLDRCYRGRDQFVCSFSAILREAKSLLEGYKKIVDLRYPDVSSISDVCNIKLDNLAVDMQKATDFANRFRARKTEYDARIGCANRIGQALRDVTLPTCAVLRRRR